jgi:hypothetical protein
VKVEYKRDLKHNYMVIWKPEENFVEPYCIRMLEESISEAILLLQQHSIDNQILFYYEITGKQSMVHLFEKKRLSHEQLKQLMESILAALELAYEHLLPEDDFILAPEYIYLDIITNTPSLCFLSGYRKDSRKQMSSLLEYLMNKVDYGDKEAVALVYQLYAVSREEDFTLARFSGILRKGNTEEIVPKDIKTRREAASINDIQSGNRPEDNGRQQAAYLRLNEKEFLLKRVKEQEKPSEHRHSEIPVVMERLDEEREVYRYPVTAYLLTGVCFITGILILVLGFTSGILYNIYGERIEYGKLMGLILILLCVETYLMRIIWNGNNKLAKIITEREYIDPRQEEMEELPRKNTKYRENMDTDLPAFESVRLTGREHSLLQSMLHRGEPDGLCTGRTIFEEKKEGMDEEEEYNPTCILNDGDHSQAVETIIQLKSLDEELCPSVPIIEFPFFIGKLRKNVDYCLKKSVVSRYHAKITKEESKYYITDLNSTNGTYVNGAVLDSYEKWELKHGDKVALANLTFEFTLY